MLEFAVLPIELRSKEDSVRRDRSHEGVLLITTTVPETVVAFVAPQLPALVKAGWVVHIATSPGLPTDFGSQHDVTVHDLPMTRSPRPTHDALALQSWISLLRQIKPSVILGSTPKAGMLSMVAGRIVGIPRRIFLHRGARWETADGFQRRLLRGADRLTVRSATEVIAVSKSLALLLEREGIAKSVPLVLGNGGSKGVDLEAFKPRDARMSAHPFTLGFVGRLSADKGIDSLVGAFDEHLDRHPHSRLVIVGDIDDSDPVAAAFIERIQNDPKIEYVGPSDDVATQIQRMDVLVFPSRREGLPNVVIEAAACGVPTVGWRVTGVTDAIADGETGRLAPYGDLESLVQAIDWVKASSRQQLRSQCRSWSLRFDQQNLTDLLVAQIGPAVRDRSV